jgi:hypothetical protein
LEATSGETYGAVGMSHSPDGAGLGAANSNGGADLVLDGSADGQPDTFFTQDGLDRPSGSDQSFTLSNSGLGGLNLIVEGILFGDGSGLSQVDAEKLGGFGIDEFVLGSQLATSGGPDVHWDNLVSKPTGLDDGDDDTLDALSCAEAEIARWTGSSWSCSEDLGSIYVRTHLVGPVGTPTQNGTALLAALLDLPTPASQQEALLLKIEPGAYDLGDQPLELRSWMDVEGSGQETTLITSAVCDVFPGGILFRGTAIGASHAELRQLTVQNTCTSGWSTAIHNEEDHARFTDLTARASGAAGYNNGLYNEGSDVVVTRVTASGRGASAWNRGMADVGVRTRISHSSATGTGGTDPIGIELFGGHTVVTDMTATARDGSSSTIGFIMAASSVTLRNVEARAPSATSGDRIGVWAFDGEFLMEGGVAAGEDAMVVEENIGVTRMIVLDRVMLNGSRYGLDVSSYDSTLGIDLFVNHSGIRGSTNSIRNSGSDVFVGGSQIAGSSVTGGRITCAGVWDGAYTFSASTCP